MEGYEQLKFIDNALEEAKRREDGEVAATITKTSKGVLFCIKNNYMYRPEISKMMKRGILQKGMNGDLGCTGQIRW